MAPQPLPIFSLTPKPPPPPPWLHGPSTQTHTTAPTAPPPPTAAEATRPKSRPHSPKPAPARKNSKTAAKPLTAGVPGGRTRRAVFGIIRRVRSLELADPPSPVPTSNAGAAVAFHLPIEPPPPREPGQGAADKVKSRAVPWAAARDEGLKVALRREKKPREPTRAETELEAGELDRLRRLARGMGRWARAKKAGVTDEVVEEMRREWARGEELAAVRIVEPLRRSMDRAREILEIKTGGLVVWTKGDIHFVYRGSNYQQNTKHSHTHTFVTDVQNISLEKYNAPTTPLKYRSKDVALAQDSGEADDAFQENDGSVWGQEDEEPVKGTLYEREVNRLLDTLGPRFIDWWWNTPLPVDADLLPEFVPGFKTPLRQCPPGVRPTLANEELTYLRKLARSLPTHFALGRNTRLQGLAAAILKLWEKSLIAKIAVKVGIQNTNNEQMAWNLKLNKKIERSNQVLAKLHSSWSPSEQSADRELLTEEEKMIFCRIGRKMDGLVLLGRRGVFGGVIEEIHQHWKHKEVVKVITKQHQARPIMYTANLLEVETGGILIAVEKLTTSHAIILYRGKNYRRPAKSSSDNLLTKREALRRSIEVQRRGSMKYFARERQESILELKSRLRYVTRQIRYRTPKG